MAEGITKRHSKGCSAREGGRCNCGAGWEASVYSPRDGKKLRKRFRRKAEARSWRAEAKRALDHGTLRAPTKVTLSQAAERWLVGAEGGEVTNRSGRPYKPSTLRGYRRDLDEYLLPELGGKKLSAVTAADLQGLVDCWQGEGKPGSTLRNRIMPLRAIYRRACTRGGLTVNPTRELELPAVRPEEIEIVAAADAAELIDAVPADDRPIWATALYAGLRYGELRALRWDAVDFVTGAIHVRESWDPTAGSIEPKTRTSRRATPMPELLRDVLLEHRLRRAEPADDALVFGQADDAPFSSGTLYRHADAAWEEAGLTGRLRLHQARHSYASYLIAAGANPKAISTFMGHASINVTFDLYGHLMPGTAAEVASLLNGYLRAQAPPGS
jgi:integrase